MKEIKVKTQEEYDAIEDQKQRTKIIIEGKEWIIIKKVPKNCYVAAGGSAHVEAGGSAHVEAWDSAHVEAWDSAHVEAWDSAHVKAGGSAHVEAWDSAHAEAWGSAHVEAGGSAHVEAYEFVTVTKTSKSVVVELFGKALIQDASEEVRFSSIEEWFAWWDMKPKKGKVIMYKAVNPDLTDFYTGKVHYKVGEVVEAPDWNDRFKGECGHALHCSPYLFQTHRYSQDPHTHIQVEVNVEDIRIVETPTMRGKVRVKKVKVLKIIEEA